MRESLFWGHTHPLSAKLKSLHKEIVPSSGSADTVTGELLRTSSNFMYDQFNNGHCNFEVKSDDYKTLISLLKSEQINLTPDADALVSHIQKCLKICDSIKDACSYVDREVECSQCYGRGSDNEESDDYCHECEGNGYVYDDDIMSPKEEIEQELYQNISCFDEDNYIKGLDELFEAIAEHTLKLETV